jgi:hypothetical protein
MFKPLVKKIKAFKLGSLDIEDDSKGNILLIVFYDGEKFWKFYDATVFKKFLKRRRYRDWVIVGNNIGYDLSGMWGLEADDVEFLYSKTQFICGKLRVQGGRWPRYVKFLDLFNHAQISVKEMGRLINLPKLDLNAAMTANARGNHDTLVTYCERDAEICYRFAKLLQDFYNGLGGQMKLTQSSSAMDIYRRKYLKITYEEIHPDVIELFRRGYYGGRVECMYVGKKRGQFYFADFKSMYPSVMVEEKLPDPDILRVAHEDISIIEKYEGMSFVVVETPDMYIPVLPYRSSVGKLLFPVGKFAGWYCHNELRYAMECGYKIHSIPVTIWSKVSDVMFKEYITDLYDRRKLATEAWEDKCLKICMNGLYGKFAQLSGLTQIMTRDDAIGHYWEYKKKFPKAELWFPPNTQIGVWYIQDRYPVHTNVVWSAYITAAARVKLHKAMGDDTLYCDTDSILGEREYQTSDELGALNLENVFTEVNLVLPKLYEFKGPEEIKRAAKGFPKSVHEEMFISNSLRAKFEKPNRYIESLRRGLVINKWETREKEVRQKYDKRRVRPDGTTEPLEVKMSAG